MKGGTMPVSKVLRGVLVAALAGGLLLLPGTGSAQVSGADLSVEKTDSPDPVAPNAPLTYTVTVENDGPEAAVGVEMEDVLPLSASFVSATPSQGTCTQLLLVVTCNLGDIADEAVAAVVIVVTASGSGTLNNVVAVESQNVDPNPLNNIATESTTVTGGSGSATDLAVDKADAPDPVGVNQNLTYTITVANGGEQPASGVVLTDVLPLGVTFVSATPTSGSCTGPILVVLICNLGDMPDGAHSTVLVVVKPTATGSIANTATVASSSPDTNPGNNISTETTDVSTTPGGGGGGGGGGGDGKGGGAGGLAACTIMGTKLDDTLVGTETDDVICGLDGNDIMTGLGGKDRLIGGTGNDKGNGGKDPDKLNGQSGKDKLRGAAKNDRLRGAGGKDRLAGGPGKDRLNGGGGRDKCRRGKGDKLTKCP
jgi:uncharacterized repeat protein (TIGR01451 family)